jgi:hypothetical protein
VAQKAHIYERQSHRSHLNSALPAKRAEKVLVILEIAERYGEQFDSLSAQRALQLDGDSPLHRAPMWQFASRVRVQSLL